MFHQADVAASAKYAQLAFLTGRKVLLAIHRAGHTTLSSITIDLSKPKKNTVVVDIQSKFATLGPGALWE